MLAKLAGGVDLGDIAHGIVEALDPDNQIAAAKEAGGSEEDEAAVAQAANKLITDALQPLSSNPELRSAILDVRKSFEQTIDEVSKDTVLVAGHSDEGTRKGGGAGRLVQAVHRGAQGRHPRPAGSLQPSLQRAIDVRRDQGPRHSDRAPAAPVDTGKTLARLRDARPVQGPWLRRQDAHGYRLARALHPGPGRRARALP